MNTYKEYLISENEHSIVLANIRKTFSNYLKQNNLHSVVLGVSGGIDSAMVIAIAIPICKELGIPLMGLCLPCDSNKKDEHERAVGMAMEGCTTYRIQNIQKEFDFINSSMISEKSEDIFTKKIREGNIKARLRMIHLYDEAQRTGGLVMSTDNLSELLLGFWTRYGDEGDYAPIRELFKTEVYALANHILSTEMEEPLASYFKRCIDAVPTDGLGITNSDLDQLGEKSYEDVDKIFIEHLLMGIDHSQKNVIKRFNKTVFKRSGTIHIKRHEICSTAFVYDTDFFTIKHKLK